MAHVRILSTGGTIASTADDADEPGKTPTMSGADVLDAVPDVDDHAEIEVEDVCRVSGFQLTFEHVNAIADAVERAAVDGVDGIVVTHGTDTMEETAYFLDLVHPESADGETVSTDTTGPPIVCTGAQRPADVLGTDGPSNLDLAVRTAAHDRFRWAGGAYLAFNDEVHAARRVTKAHASKIETFESPDAGPIAERTPSGLRFLREPESESSSIPGARVDSDVRVEIVTNATGVDGRQVRSALAAGADGFVVAGTGLGNTTRELGAALESALDADVPVVLASRCHAGATDGVYGGAGGAKTLLEAGAISGGDLPAWKARLLVLVTLSGGRNPEAVRETFEGSDSR